MTKAERYQILRDAEIIRKVYLDLGKNPLDVPLSNYGIRHSMAELIAMADPEWGTPEQILEELIETEKEKGFKYPT